MNSQNYDKNSDVEHGKEVGQLMTSWFPHDVRKDTWSHEEWPPKSSLKMYLAGNTPGYLH